MAEITFINMEFIVSLEYELCFPIVIISYCIQIFLVYPIMLLLEKSAVSVNNIG